MLRTNARTDNCTQRATDVITDNPTGESTEDGTNGQLAGVGRIIAIFVAAVFITIAVVTVFVGVTVVAIFVGVAVVAVFIGVAVVTIFVGIAVVAVFIGVVVVAGSRRERTVIRIGRIKTSPILMRFSVAGAFRRKFPVIRTILEIKFAIST